MRERERKKVEAVVRDTTFGWGWGVRNYISDFEGSQAVPACPSGIDKAHNRIFLLLYIFMTLEVVHYSKIFC
jgi:hypothetical protein